MMSNKMDVASPHTKSNLINKESEPGLIRKLCEELIQKRIKYCHWKSNAALARSVSGENDLDLLINRADGQRFTEILTQLGFKLAISQPIFQIPGVLDYYGYDLTLERLVHVHAHYQLILGHDATKNYRIPVEQPYLMSSYQNGMFMVPSPEFELIIFVIRMMLKHSTWDTLLLHQGSLSSSERNELDYLLQHSSEIGIYKVLNQHLSCIAPRLFSTCLQSLTSDRPILERAWIGQRLLNCIEPYARRPQIVDCGLKIWRRVAWPLGKRIFRSDDRKKIKSGGKLVAIVGGDGAGKTTVVEEVYKWLSDDFQVRRFHMGKPKWSFLTVLVRGIIKIGRSFGFYPFMRSKILYTNDSDLLIFPGYPWLIREICTARDRLLTYIKARRLATDGTIVILDRFPLPQIRFMDGPQVSRMTANIPDTKLIRFLIHLEESYYQKMALPDLIILLLTDPEIAIQRKTDEDKEEVRSRSTEIWKLDWSQTPAALINANRSKEEVFLEVKGLLWSRL
jgi:thymidylate kinase